MSEEGKQSKAVDAALGNLLSAGKAKHERKLKAKGIEAEYVDNETISSLKGENQGESANAKSSGENSTEDTSVQSGMSATSGVIQTSTTGQSDEDPPIDKNMSPQSQEGFKQLRDRKKQLERDLKELTKQLEERDGNLSKLLAEKADLESKLGNLSKDLESSRKTKEIIEFKTAEEIEEEFIAPVNNAVQTLQNKFREYGVAESVLTEALGLSGIAEIEEYIEENISSPRLKSLVYETFDKIADLNRRRVEAEKNPGETLNRLREEKRLSRDRERALAVETIEKEKDRAFEEAMLFNKAQGDLALPYFMETSDPEHNEKIFKPSVQKAKQVMDTLLQPFKTHGIKVPQDYLTFVARLAQVGSVATTEYAGRLSYATELAAVKKANEELTKKIESLQAKGNPAPKQVAGGKPQASSTGQAPSGKNVNDRFSNFMQTFRNS